MIFPFCITDRQAYKGKHVDRKDPQQQPEQARVALSFTPKPQGQAETERLLSGDTNAFEDLKSLLARAESRSRQLPRLNLNVRATDKFLQGNPEAIEDLLEEQRLAQARVKKASGQWLGMSLMGNASLVDEGKCRGHLKFHYCTDGEGCNAQYPQPSTSHSHSVTSQDVEKQTKQPVPSEEEDEDEDEDEDEEEFSFDDHFADEDDYQQALHDVTAFAVTPARAKSILIPARIPSLSRKRGHSSLRESSSLVRSGSEAAPSESLSTQEAPGGSDASPGLAARRSDLLSYRFRRAHLHLNLFDIRGPFPLPRRAQRATSDQ